MDYKENNYERPRNSFLPSFIGAVIGGLITLIVVFSLGVVEPMSESSTPNPEIQTEAAEVSTVPVKTISSSSNSLVQTIEEVSPAVVGIINIQQQRSLFSGDVKDVESGTGSGVVFKKTDNAAYIVTNNHVVEGATKIEVALANEQRVPAKIVGTDPLTDLAVISIDPSYVTATATFGDSSLLKIGEPVVAIGNPLGLQFSKTVTKGIISGTQHTIPVQTSSGEWDLTVIQTDAAINPGNSGGPLINQAGQVIGINSLKIAQSGVEGLGFAIPSNDVLPIIDDLMTYGEVQRPYVGVQLQDVNALPLSIIKDQLYLPDDVTHGVVIISVQPNSPGAHAGLQPKDVIVGIDDTEINNIVDLRKFLYTEVEIGDQVQIKIYRNGKPQTLSMKVQKNMNL